MNNTKEIGVMCHLGGINPMVVDKEELTKDPVKALENLLKRVTGERVRFAGKGERAKPSKCEM